MLYVIIVLICATILSTVNIAFFQDYLSLNWWEIILIVVGYIVAVILLDALVALIVNKSSKKLYKKEYRIFKIFKWERKFYEKLGIKKWKDKIPELGKLGNFSKGKVLDPKNSEYISKFIEECIRGEVTHITSCFIGFL